MSTQGVVAIVSHDAGGAEILASYVSQHKLICRFVLEGPALKVFKRRLGAVEISSLSEALPACHEILCGTSWQSDLEWRATGQAQSAGKRTVAFLDHWINYPERFVRNGVQHLPDELWVGDAEAERLAREHFPNVPIRLEPNPYFIDIQRQIAELGIGKEKPAVGKGKTVLYVSENISGHARATHGDERYLGYTEFDAIEYFLENINVLGEVIEKVVIRPHPSDPSGKYDYLTPKYCIVRFSSGEPLFKEIAEADIVVGSQSVAMVVGLLANKMVISCIPPGGPKCNLPQEQILIFSDMVSTAQRSRVGTVTS
jgi:hypothetical protein